MGKGRDKRKKHEDPSKAAKRAAKHTSKILKSEAKNSDEKDPMAAGFNNEESIEVTLKRIQKTESKLKTTSELDNVPPPSSRCNAVLVPHPSRENELILFGGEYWDGDVTTAYNDLYTYHIKKGKWSKLSSAVNPAPRSSCQGINYKHYTIIFGGEFVSQSQSQYLHFRDVWRYDSKKSEWEELKSLKGGPSSRSGHRMCLWKRNAVVFGGFYDNAQECRYYNDLYFLSQLDGHGSWTQIQPASTPEMPHPRSGHTMAVHNDTLFVFGGYSTEKFNRFKKSEATVHHDLWMINLPPVETAHEARPVWTKVKLAGIPPPIRSGVSFAYKDKKLYLFGGVVDIESPGGKMISSFSNDLFVFHMDTKKFYPIVLRAHNNKENDGKKKNNNLCSLESQLNELNLVGDENSESDEDDYDEQVNLQDDPYNTTEAKKDSTEMKESYEQNSRGQILPHRRMDAAMTVIGTTLYLYGGQFEAGSKEITMSDMFALNLNKLDTYQVLLSQDLSAAVWLGKESEANTGSWESGSTVVSATFDCDYDEDDEEEDENDDDINVGGQSQSRARRSSRDARGAAEVALALKAGNNKINDDDDDDDDVPEAIPVELDAHVTPEHHIVASAIDGITTTGKKGLKVHKEQLLAQLSSVSAVPTPVIDETFSDFFTRTLDFWMQTAKESFEGSRSERKTKKEAAEFARNRFHEAKELLRQLKQVEEREEVEKQFFKARREQKEREWEEYEAEQARIEEEEAREKANKSSD